MLKIAQVGSLWENTPPKKYGGTERVIWSLTEGLHRKGHQVTLFAAGTSQTSAKLISVYPRPLIEDKIPWTNLTYPLLNISECLERQKEYDIIHMHLNKSSDYLSLPLFNSIKHKVIFTLHFPYPLSQNRIDRHLVFQKYKHLNFVSISNAARQGGENLHWLATIYNGIESSDFAFTKQPQDYLLWLGKFNPDKGSHLAIEAAKKAKVKILIAGKIDALEKEDYQYYLEKIKPLLNQDDVQYVGEVGGKKKSDLFGRAIAFLNPIVWNEPFGLVMAESLATGTPVISFNRGAAPEIIEDGKSGYLVNTVDEMVEKITQITHIQRKNCRRRFESRFTSQIMVNNYEQLYKKLLSKSQ